MISLLIYNNKINVFCYIYKFNNKIMIKYNFKCIYYHFLTEDLLSFSFSFSLYLIGSFFLFVFGLKISHISSI